MPTTGIAASLPHQPGVDRLVTAHRGTLGLLDIDPTLAPEAARERFGFDEGKAAWAASAVRRYFTSDGRVSAAHVEAALRAIGATTSPYASQAVSSAPQSHRVQSTDPNP
jgi:hypothetical protein